MTKAELRVHGGGSMVIDIGDSRSPTERKRVLELSG